MELRLRYNNDQKKKRVALAHGVWKISEVFPSKTYLNWGTEDEEGVKGST